MAFALSPSRLVMNSGAKSEAYIKALYPQLPPQAFVHYGNFIGDALSIAQEMHFASVSLGIMVGKAVKLAEGNLDTHSKKVVMNKDFLHNVAYEVGASSDTHALIDELSMARELWGIPTIPERDRLLLALLRRCHSVTASQLSPDTPIVLHLISEGGETILSYPEKK